MTPVATLKSDAPETVLREALRTTPQLVQTVQTEVYSLHQAIMKHHLATRLGLGGYYAGLLNRLGQHKQADGWAPPAQRKAADEAALRQLRLVLDARRLLSVVLEDLGHVSGAAVLSITRAGDCPAAINRAVRALMTAHPGLSEFQKRLDAELERVTAAQDADRHRLAEGIRVRQEQERRGAAADLVQRLSRGGVTISLDAKGITARPMGMLSATDLAAIRELKTELTQLLRQPAELVA